MRVRLITAILLILCSVWIGRFAYENLMWAVWGKQNQWFEYVGFWGCAMMFISGLVALKNLRLGSIFGCVSFVLMLFYLGPAVVNTIYALIVGNLTLKAAEMTQFVFIIGIPIITLARLIWTVKKYESA
jgi:hypothetical protein